MRSLFKNKVVLITGGTGSLGKALLSRIKDAKEIRVFSRSEANQIPLQTQYPKVKFILGDVADLYALKQALTGVDIVIHAAAFKFLNLAETQARECVITNVLGSLNLLLAIDIVGGVEKCVGISTDKVVYARNVYGCTKHIMEKLFREASRHSKTKFACVRYGNVFGTTGSVVTIWSSQVARGVPITLTDKRMTRFFFDVDDAVDLIFHALAHMKGGEVFVRKMQSKKLVDMAQTYSKKIKIKITGLRPGEKLHEALIGDYEGKQYTSDMALDYKGKEIVVIK